MDPSKQSARHSDSGAILAVILAIAAVFVIPFFAGLVLVGLFVARTDIRQDEIVAVEVEAASSHSHSRDLASLSASESSEHASEAHQSSYDSTAQTAPRTAKAVVVEVRQDGTISAGGTPLDFNKLAAWLANQRPDKETKLAIEVRADGECRFEDVQRVLQHCQSSSYVQSLTTAIAAEK